jgi:hypothetical protein
MLFQKGHYLKPKQRGGRPPKIDGNAGKLLQADVKESASYQAKLHRLFYNGCASSSLFFAHRLRSYLDAILKPAAGATVQQIHGLFMSQEDTVGLFAPAGPTGPKMAVHWASDDHERHHSGATLKLAKSIEYGHNPE